MAWQETVLADHLMKITCFNEIKPRGRCLNRQLHPLHSRLMPALSPTCAALLPQNAGPLRGIHAECTKSKIRENLNPLFFMDFLFNSILAQSLHYS